MSTINDRAVIDRIIANNGWYEPNPEEIRIVRIVEYNNDFNGAVAYGCIFEGEDLQRYHNSPYVHNPKIIWEAPTTGS